jgi:hypothetical protein
MPIRRLSPRLGLPLQTRVRCRGFRIGLLLTDIFLSRDTGACTSINAPTSLANATDRLAASGCKLSSTAWRLRGVLHFGTSPDQGSSAALARPCPTSPSSQARHLWDASRFFYSVAVFHLRSPPSHISISCAIFIYAVHVDASLLPLVVMPVKTKCEKMPRFIQ